MRTNHKYFFSLLILNSLVLGGCTAVYFAQPQPGDVPALNSFPEEIQGAYLVGEDEDKDTIYIEAKRFTYPEEDKYAVPVDEIDSLENIRIIDGMLYDNTRSERQGINYNIKNDTVYYRVKTLMSKFLSDSLVLKKQGEFYTLNDKVEGKDYWHVYLVEKLQNGNLLLSAVGNFETEDISGPKLKYDGKLKDFFKITNFQRIDEGEFLIDPSEKEFKRLIRKGLFVEFDQFKKLNEN